MFCFFLDPPRIVNVFFNNDSRRFANFAGKEICSFNFTLSKCQSCNKNNIWQAPFFHLKLDFLGPLKVADSYIISHLANLLDSQSMADVMFIVKDEKIGAHSLIIKSASAKMAAILRDQNKVSSTEAGDHTYSESGSCKEIFIDDVAPQTFRRLLRYIYTGATPESEQEAELLLPVAYKYDIDDLKKLCEKLLTCNVSSNSVVRYLVLAHENGSPQLMEAAMNYVIRHKKELWNSKDWKDLMKNRSELFFLVSHKMMD